jgi:hypothetical protein
MMENRGSPSATLLIVWMSCGDSDVVARTDMAHVRGGAGEILGRGGGSKILIVGGLTDALVGGVTGVELEATALI